MKRRWRLRLALLVLAGLFAAPAWAQDNPFRNRPAAPAAPQAAAPVSPTAGEPASATWVETLVGWQKQFHAGVAKTLREARDNPWSLALWSLLAFAFLYGILHTLLPGHQKAVIGAYFLSENARYSQGFLAGLVFALFHALSSLGLLVMFRLVLGLTAKDTLDHGAVAAQLVSGAGVLVLGSILLYQKLTGLKELRRLDALDQMRRRLGFDLHQKLLTVYEPLPWRRFLPMMFFAALLPCPGTLLVLFLALGTGTFHLGLAAVLAISLGMAVTLMLLALGIIWLKKRGKGLTYRTPGRWGVFALELAGLAAVVVLSLLLIPFGPLT